MTDTLVDCAYGGAWLMGGITLLVLFLLLVCVTALLVRGGPFRRDIPARGASSYERNHA